MNMMILEKISSNKKKKISMNSICHSKNTVDILSFIISSHFSIVLESRVYRGTSRGRPRGRGRPPLYGRINGRTSHSGQLPRGVNHLTTGSYQSSQRLIQPVIKASEPPVKNKRKPAKVKSVSVPSASEEKSKRPGKILRSGRISRKPRRDSETDFGSDNSDDSGAKDKASGSDNDDEEFNLGFNNPSNLINKDRDGSSLSSSNHSLTNFASFAQNQLLATGLLPNPDDRTVESDVTSDGFDSDQSDENVKKDLDEFTYKQTMLALIQSMQPNEITLNLELSSRKTIDPYLHYENFYQTNPLATRKQMLLNERDRRAHLARKFSINHSPSFSWYSPSTSFHANYTVKHISDILRLTLVHFENTIPLPFMHSHWKQYRYHWAKILLDLDHDLSLNEYIHHLLQFESCIKPVSYFDLFLDQVGYLKFRRETEKERDEAKKEEKDALIRRKIEADSIVQNVHFTRPLKHSVHRQRGEDYRLTGGQGWTFIRSTRRIIPSRKKQLFDLDSLLLRRENMSNVILNERQRIWNLLEMKVKNDLTDLNGFDEEMKKILDTAKDDQEDVNDEMTLINYQIIDYHGIQYRYPNLSNDTRRSFHLTRISTKKPTRNPFQLPLPWTFSFDKNQSTNIFILPSYILRRLARGSMNFTDVPGFLNSRLTGIGTRFGWPYPCGRPSVRTAWCYKVQTSTSFFALAHHFKYLWHCIRWDLLTEKITSTDESSITTHVDQDGITTIIQVLAKRDSGPYDSYCEYFVRKTISSSTHENNPFNTIPMSKSRSRAVPHPSSILANNRLILTEQWLPERQLQPNQIKYYYQCLQEKAFKRLQKKSNPETIKTKTTAKPFIVRIPHLQPKSILNTETGKVVLVKSNNETNVTTNKSFSVVKLADGQIILVPTISNDQTVTKPLPPPPPPTLSPQERRLRLIAPLPLPLVHPHNDTPVPKTKNIRKSTPSIPIKKEPQIDPEEPIRRRICEDILRSLISRIEREQTDRRIRSRHLLNQRVEGLRKEFLQQRLRQSSNDENNHKKMKSKKIITIKNSSNKTNMSLSDINCTCQRIDVKEKFFIQCELCSRWLHGQCVGLTPRTAEKLTEFICESCQVLTEKSKQRLYCLCQCPYDESKFYIGCDVCADWLHGTCVKISPEEAEKFEVYVCPRCSTEKKQEFINQSIDQKRKDQLLKLIEQLLVKPL